MAEKTPPPRVVVRPRKPIGQMTPAEMQELAKEIYGKTNQARQAQDDPAGVTGGRTMAETPNDGTAAIAVVKALTEGTATLEEAVAAVRDVAWAQSRGADLDMTDPDPVPEG